LILIDRFALHRLTLPAQRAYEGVVLEAVENPLELYFPYDLADGRWTAPVMELLIHSYWRGKVQEKGRERYLREHFLREQAQCLDWASSFLWFATLQSPPAMACPAAAISAFLEMFPAVSLLYNAVLLHRPQTVSGKFSISVAHSWVETLLY
jgi:hypothetical protein